MRGVEIIIKEEGIQESEGSTVLMPAKKKKERKQVTRLHNAHLSASWPFLHWFNVPVDSVQTVAE